MFFDTMLYPLYRDYESGLVKVVESDAFVHLSGTVVTYRKFLDFSGRCVGDELFRLLFLSLLNELSPHFASECRLPSVEELSLGLRDSARRVHYCFPEVAGNYLEFREAVRKLIETPLFSPYGQKMKHLLMPFDEILLSKKSAIEPTPPKMRSHGLWLN